MSRTHRMLIISMFLFTTVAIFTSRVHLAVATNEPGSPPVAVTDNYTVHNSLNTAPAQNDYDPDGCCVIFDSIATQPQHGHLSYNGVGNYIYTANAGYTGPDSYTYNIRDPQWNYATGTVNLNVVNQAPVTNTDTYTVQTPRNTNPKQNDTDPDGDGTLFVGIASNPTHGTLSYNGVGNYIYTPAYGYVGSDSYTYTIRDTLYAYSTGTVNINVVNQAPTPVADFYVLHSPLQVYPMQNDGDPDGDGILFDSIVSQPSNETLAYVGI